jgi:DNA (cytosine-5)-methyltransferase 1
MNEHLTHGSLFSGIGGFDLAAHWAGIETLWMCEKDEKARNVLEKHRPAYWPNAVIYEDITETDWSSARPVDIISGGFPCQPWSLAGQRRGEEDDRHLWPDNLFTMIAQTKQQQQT